MKSNLDPIAEFHLLEGVSAGILDCGLTFRDLSIILFQEFLSLFPVRQHLVPLDEPGRLEPRADLAGHQAQVILVVVGQQLIGVLFGWNYVGIGFELVEIQTCKVIMSNKIRDFNRF